MNIFKTGSLLKNYYFRLDIYKPKFIKYRLLGWMKIIDIGCVRFLWGKRMKK